MLFRPGLVLRVLLICAVLGCSLSLWAQCDEVQQGTEPALSGCLQCPFPAAISGNNGFATATAGGDWCTTIENDEFIGFTAVCATVAFEINATNCTAGNNGIGLQVAVVDADFNLYGCTTNLLGSSQFSATLPSCGDYYIRVDGVAGSACDYTITPVQGILDVNFQAPTAPGVIAGPARLCEGDAGSYTYTPPPSSSCGAAPLCADLCWDIRYSNPLLSTAVIVDPSGAFGFVCSETGVMTVQVEIDDLSALPPGSIEYIYLTATPSYSCLGPGVSSEEFEIVVSRPADEFELVFACPGEDYVLDGSPYGIGTHYVNQADANGCPYELTLVVQSYAPSFGPTIPVAICAGEAVTLCPDNPILNPSAGTYSCALTGQAATGCDSILLYDVYLLDPRADIESVATHLNCNQTSITASVGALSSQGDTTSYQWTTDGGAFTATADQFQIEITAAGTYYLSVTVWSDRNTSQRCTAMDTLVITEDTATGLAAPQISGPLTVCMGASASYAAGSAAGVTSYSWTSTGSTPAAGNAADFAVQWPSAGTYQVCLSVANTCSSSPETCIDVLVSDDQPVFNLIGPSSACPSSSIAFGINPYAASAQYSISRQPPGAVATIVADSVQLILGDVGGQLCIQGRGDCGAATEVCTTITVAARANAPVVSGPAMACQGSTATYTLAADPLITAVDWTATGAIVLSQSSTQAELRWTSDLGQEVCVEITDACGIVQSTCINVTVKAPPSASISGGGTYCPSETPPDVVLSYSGASTVTLHYTGAGVAQQVTTSSSPYTINSPAAGVYRLDSIRSAGGCFALAAGEVTVVESEVPTGTLSGNYERCAGETTPVDITLTLTGTAPWSLVLARDGVPLPNITTSDPNYVYSAALDGRYTIEQLSDATACGGQTSGAATVSVMEQVELVSYVETCQPDNATYTVTVTLSGGDVASYQNLGATPGTFSGSTFTSTLIPSGSGYDLEFADNSGCGGPALVVPSVACNCNNSAGTMATDLVEQCGPETIILNLATSGAGSAAEADDLLSFYLHEGSFGALVNVLDSSQVPSFSFDTARMLYGRVYYVSAVSANAGADGFPDRADPCLNVAVGQGVVWHSLPAAEITSVSAACIGEEAELSLQLTGVGPFRIEYSVAGVATSASFPTSSASIRVLAKAAPQQIQLTSIVDANGCVTNLAETAAIVAFPALDVKDEQRTCNATGTAYTVVFDMLGGDAASLSVAPAGSGSLDGRTFTSNPISSGSGYSFTVTDTNGCASIMISSAAYSCTCTSEAAAITSDLITGCGPTVISLSHSHASSTLDADDATGYVLHTAAGSVLGSIVMQNATPEFSFDAGLGMNYGTTYYVSPVVGNGLANGQVDLSDPCLAVAAGQAVVWQEEPSATLVGEAQICAGSSTQLSLQMQGDGPFDVNFSIEDDAGLRDTTLRAIPSTFDLTVAPTATSTYTLTSVSTSACTAPVNSAVVVDVQAPLSAGEAATPLHLCVDDGAAVALQSLLSGADAGGRFAQLTGGSQVALNSATGSFVNSGLGAGSYEFGYTVGEGSVCPVDEARIIFEVEAAPTADAGADSELDCTASAVALGGDSTSFDENFIYRWQGGAVEDANAAHTTTTQAGTYTLTVLNAAGRCADTDAVVVSPSAGDSMATDVLVQEVACETEATGAIFVAAPTGGESPYMFNLNGSEPQQSTAFAGLSAGEYLLTTHDANGCQLEQTVVINPPAAVAVDVGPDLEVSFGESRIVELHISGDVDEIIWSGGPVLCLDETCSRVELSPQQSSVYQVQVSNAAGCESSAMLQVLVRRARPVFVPSAFSPNGDGVNDYFFVQAPPGVVASIKNMNIFNRWGEVLYSRTEVQPNAAAEGWDGRIRGQPASVGVYVYTMEVVFADGVVETLKGEVAILR